MKGISVWFPLHNPGDTLLQLNNGGYPGTSLVPIDPSLLGQCWNEVDTNGNERFCTMKFDGAPLQNKFMDSLTHIPYSIDPLPFSAVLVDGAIVWRPQ